MDQENHFLLFTNKDRGCTEQEIDILQKEIPLLDQGKRFTTWVLTKEYADLPAESALDYERDCFCGHARNIVREKNKVI